MNMCINFVLIHAVFGYTVYLDGLDKAVDSTVALQERSGDHKVSMIPPSPGPECVYDIF